MRRARQQEIFVIERLDEKGDRADTRVLQSKLSRQFACTTPGGFHVPSPSRRHQVPFASRLKS
jgi:hypothetical protein